jgi:predicted GIY-YIG superfamily endonuclease
MEHIYILKLGDGKYYIGKTKNVEKRWTEHITGNGSGWTKRYKPMSLIKTVVSTSYFDEDKYVKEYMSKYGIENVRGGTYSNIDLDTNCISLLEKEIRHSKNLCTRCGRDTHFIKDCYAKTDSNDNIIIDNVSKDKDKAIVSKYNKKTNAYKAKTKNKEKSLNEDDDELTDNEESDNDECYEGKKKKVVKKSLKVCDICGMKGHSEVNCYNF